MPIHRRTAVGAKPNSASTSRTEVLTPSVEKRGEVLAPSVTADRRELFEQTLVLLTSQTPKLDTSNRSTRTPFAWLLDNTPSVTDFHESEWHTGRQMILDLRANPLTGRALVIDAIQMSVPQAVSTGFREIAEFELPDLVPCATTPVHLALALAVTDFSAIVGSLREVGLERTQAVCIISTDGHANDCTETELRDSIARFHEMCSRVSVTPIVVGVGRSLNVPVLKALSTIMPPIQLDQLKVNVLVPFIEKLAVSASRSRQGQSRIAFELPPEMRPLE